MSQGGKGTIRVALESGPGALFNANAGHPLAREKSAKEAQIMALFRQFVREHLHD